MRFLRRYDKIHSDGYYLWGRQVDPRMKNSRKPSIRNDGPYRISTVGGEGYLFKKNGKEIDIIITPSGECIKNLAEHL